jgi:hypothetical protein
MPRAEHGLKTMCMALLREHANFLSERCVKIFRSRGSLRSLTEKLAPKRKENQCGAPSAKRAFLVLL